MKHKTVSESVGKPVSGAFRFSLTGLLTLSLTAFLHAANVPLQTSRSLFVATNGNNATAEAESLSQPFADPRAAKAVAAAGDTIYVFAGTYRTNNLLKNGVNWHFYPGSRVEYTDTNGTGIGIWDDRGNGACTSSITGFGTFYLRSASNDTANLDLLGTVTITNPASEVSIQCKRLEGTFQELNVQAVVNIKNCRRVFVEADEVIDPWPRNTFFFDDGALTQLAASTTGIYWEHGEFHSRVRRVWVSGYALYGNEVTVATAIENWWHSGDYLDNELGAGAVGTPTTCLYMVGKTALWKYWVDVLDARTENAVVWTHFGSGKGYVSALKLGTSHSTGVGLQISNTGTNELWLTAQKLSTKGGWIQLASPNAGTCYASVQHYEDAGSATGFQGFNVASGKLIVDSGTGLSANGTEIVHSGGTAVYRSVRLGNPARTNSAVNVSTNGLTIEHSTLLTSNTFFTLTTSLNATQSVRLMNVFATSTLTNKITNAVVIGSYGPFNSSSAVQ